MANSPVKVLDFRGTYKGGGGPDKTILNSAAQHDSSRVDVLVCYLRQPDDTDFQIGEVAKSMGLNYVEFVDRSLLDWSCIVKLRRLILKENLALVHSHDDKTLLYSVILKLLVPGLRIMHTCHSHADYGRESFNSAISYTKFRIRKKILIWLMARHYPPILTVSENTRQRLIAGGLPEENVSVLYNGIDIEEWKRSNGQPVLRRELGLTDEQFLVGTVARITYDKDLPTFFEIVRLVNARNPNTKFVIVGDGYGNELEIAKKEARAMNLDDLIHFTGHRNDLKNIYSSLDVFLMTSRTEGLPNTVLEAMALEVPVVSTAVGGVPELVVDQKVGLLAPVHDAAGLADHVCIMLEQDEVRNEMSRESRKLIENKFDFAKRVELLEKIYIGFITR